MTSFTAFFIATAFAVIPILCAIVLAIRSRKFIRASLPTKFIRIHIFFCLIALPLFYLISILWLLHPFVPLIALSSAVIPTVTFGVGSAFNIAAATFDTAKDMFTDLHGIFDIVSIPEDTKAYAMEALPPIEKFFTIWTRAEIRDPYRHLFAEYPQLTGMLGYYSLIPEEQQKEFPVNELMNLTNTVFQEHGSKEMEDSLKDAARAVLKILRTLTLRKFFGCSSNIDQTEQGYQDLLNSLDQVVENANVINMLKGESPSPELMVTLKDVESKATNLYKSFNVSKIIHSDCMPLEAKNVLDQLHSTWEEGDLKPLLVKLYPNETLTIPNPKDMWNELSPAVRFIIVLQVVLVSAFIFISYIFYNSIRLRAQSLLVRRYRSRIRKQDRSVKGWLYTASITGLCFAVVETIPWCFLLGLTYNEKNDFLVFLASLLHCLTVIPLYTATQTRVVEPVAVQDGKGWNIRSRIWAFVIAVCLQSTILIWWGVAMGRLVISTSVTHIWYVLLLDLIICFMLLRWERSICSRVIHKEQPSESSVTTETHPPEHSHSQ